MDTARSQTLFDRATRVTPGGVNSPVRAFGAVGGSPRFIRSGEGCTLTDVDGNRYIDMVGSWGPLLLGHRPAAVIAAIERALSTGTSFGAPTEAEVELAEAVLERAPAADRVRFVNSGTEATMSAIRLARGTTGRHLLVKLAGHYHGHADSLLVAAGSGALTTGVPSSAGVPPKTASDTLLAAFNDLASLEALFDEYGSDIAAVILEPVAGNMGVVPPAAGFLEGVRELTRRHGAAMIVDEVMTGFRVARGGAAQRYGLEPDLVTWGKVIGGGLPVGAYGGTARYMDSVSPLGPVYQAGTLSGNPLAMAAGLATLRAVDDAGDVYDVLEARGHQLEAGLADAASDAGVAVRINRVGSMLTVFFTGSEVRGYAEATASDEAAFARWFQVLLDRGVYWPPSQYESAFLSYAHRPEDIDAVVDAAAAAFRAVVGGSG